MSKPSKLIDAIFVINDPTAPRLCPELAKEIGLNESILLLQIEFWIRLTPKEHDGKLWAYESVRDFQDTFKFWSLATVNRTIQSLIKQELVFVGNYNQYKYDRTRWFALNPKGIAKLHSIKWQGYDTGSTQNETASMQDGTGLTQDDTTIPELSSDLSSESKGAQPAPAPLEEKEADELYNAMQSQSAGMVRQEHTAATASPQITERQFVREYAPVFALICQRAKPITEDRQAARRAFGKHFDVSRMNERLTAYQNGDGGEFRKHDATAFWIVNRLEKDLAQRVPIQNNDALIKARLMAA